MDEDHFSNLSGVTVYSEPVPSVPGLPPADPPRTPPEPEIPGFLVSASEKDVERALGSHLSALLRLEDRIRVLREKKRATTADIDSEIRELRGEKEKVEEQIVRKIDSIPGITGIELRDGRCFCVGTQKRYRRRSDNTRRSDLRGVLRDLGLREDEVSVEAIFGAVRGEAVEKKKLVVRKVKH